MEMQAQKVQQGKGVRILDKEQVKTEVVYKFLPLYLQQIKSTQGASVFPFESLGWGTLPCLHTHTIGL